MYIATIKEWRECHKIRERALAKYNFPIACIWEMDGKPKLHIHVTKEQVKDLPKEIEGITVVPVVDAIKLE